MNRHTERPGARPDKRSQRWGTAQVKHCRAAPKSRWGRACTALRCTDPSHSHNGHPGRAVALVNLQRSNSLMCMSYTLFGRCPFGRSHLCTIRTASFASLVPQSLVGIPLAPLGRLDIGIRAHTRRILVALLGSCFGQQDTCREYTLQEWARCYHEGTRADRGMLYTLFCPLPADTFPRCRSCITNCPSLVRSCPHCNWSA